MADQDALGASLRIAGSASCDFSKLKFLPENRFVAGSHD